MAPKKTKQALLPFNDFFKNPSQKTLKHHNKLLCRLSKSGCVKVSKGKLPGWFLKKEEKKMKEEKALQDGANAWREYLDGSTLQETSAEWNTRTLFQVYGPAPK